MKRPPQLNVTSLAIAAMLVLVNCTGSNPRFVSDTVIKTPSSTTTVKITN